MLPAPKPHTALEELLRALFYALFAQGILIEFALNSYSFEGTGKLEYCGCPMREQQQDVKAGNR